MQEPCRSCPEKTKDFGGCRCQTYMLTGDATNADPVCDLSPKHHVITEVIDKAQNPSQPVTVHPIVFRDDNWYDWARAGGFFSRPSRPSRYPARSAAAAR